MSNTLYSPGKQYGMVWYVVHAAGCTTYHTITAYRKDLLQMNPRVRNI